MTDDAIIVLPKIATGQKGGGNMANIYKLMVSVVIWILFVLGAGSIIGGFGRIISDDATTELMAAYFGLGILSLFLTVVTIKIKRKID